MDGDGGGRNAGCGAMSLDRGVDDPAVGGFPGVKVDVLNSFLASNHGKKRLQNELPREARAPVVFSSGIEFPLALGGKDRGIVPGKAAPAASQLSGSSDDADDGCRPRVSEMDFFSDEKMKKAAGSTARSPSGGDEAHPKTGTVPIKEEDFSEAVNTRLHLLTANTGSDQSTVDDGMPAGDEKEGKSELATMEAALARMKEENHRLRGMLSQVTANYNTLQTQVVHLVQQRNQMHTNLGAREAADAKVDATKPAAAAASVFPRQFMDLGPATAGDEPSNSSTEVGSPARSGSPQNNAEVASTDYHQREGGGGAPSDHVKAGIGGDDGREDSPEGESQGWAPNKLPKLNPANNSGEQSQEAILRKARVSVRARSDAPMIADGCQWRKYGQKMAKGNPCPRAYYRCTMAAGCPVRKQVQRCAEDRSVLITTYEGTHNHPLPVTAMGFASTTAAAASMLLSGSMPSTDGMMCSNFLTRTLLPSSSSMATISASAPFPTVTLDLTHHPAPPHPQKPPQPPPASGIFPFTTPNAAPAAAAPSTAGMTAQLFGQALSNQSKFSGLHMSQDANHHSHHPQVPVLQQQQPPSLADTVSAATAAITSDPNFKAALAAAITSIIGGGSHPPAINGNPLNILDAFNSSNTTTANIRNGGGGGNSSYSGS